MRIQKIQKELDMSPNLLENVLHLEYLKLESITSQQCQNPSRNPDTILNILVGKEFLK